MQIQEQSKKSVREKILESIFGVKAREEKEEKPKSLGDAVAGRYCPKAGCRLIIDEVKSGVEANYYWLLRFMENKEDFGLRLSGEEGSVLKLKDIFAAGEASSLWGSVEQRKAIQQEKVSGYLATIGKMIKDMFQIIRELRILDERYDYYKGYNQGSFSHSVALKSVWVDLVEGGSKNPGSVTGLASQVGFVILPDLFYRINLQKPEEVDKEMKKLENNGINKKVLEVLARKLVQFLEWKVKTEKEISDRKNFVLKYLRQHFNVIRMYISWLKPYLQNIKQLQSKSSFEDPHLVSTFETNKVELELLGIRKRYDDMTPNGFIITKEFKKYFPCLLVKIRFIALPEMAFQKEYQRGAVHLGRTEIIIQGYAATQKDIEAYKEKIEKEDFEVIASLESSLNSLKDELFKYLNQAEENYIPELKEDIIEIMEKTGVKKQKAIEALQKTKSVQGAVLELTQKESKDTIFSPFKGIYDGFKEILNIKSKTKEKALPLKKAEEESEKEKAKKEAGNMMWILYDVYKKAHGYLNPL